MRRKPHTTVERRSLSLPVVSHVKKELANKARREKKQKNLRSNEIIDKNKNKLYQNN